MDDPPFSERVAAQVDADLELAARSRLPEEDRETAMFIRARACAFGDMGEEAVEGVAVPLMVVVAGTGYQHGEQVGMFGPLDGPPRRAIEAIAIPYRGTLEERGRVLVQCVAEGLRGQFTFAGGQSVDDAFGSFWSVMQGTLGNEPRFDAPARELFRFGAALYAVETTIVLNLIREDRYARAEAAISRNERRRRLRFWSR